MEMKNMKWMMVSAISLLAFSSCSDEWDSHYEENKIVVNNDALSEVAMTSEAFLQQHAAEYSSMYQLLSENDVFVKLQEKNLLHTLLVVKNESFAIEGVDESDSVAMKTLANSHISDIALPPSNLYDGQRIMMWHQKFVSVAMDTAKVSTDVSRISFGGRAVSEVIKTTNGYIYVIDNLIHTPKSMKDLIEGLGDEYSIFKDLVLSSGGKEFDKEHSKPIGVDPTGNTIYDTVWIYTNEFFDAKNFSLDSESLTATALLFSDDVINKAMADADVKLKAWNQDERDREVLRRWILEVAFFNKEYSAAEMSNGAASRLNSIYNRQWWTDVQSVDLGNVEEVSNGVAYYVTDFRIPNNVLMYRLKDYYHHYEVCDDIEKGKYFKATNLSDFSCSTDVAAWTPLVGVWPEVENRALNAKYTDVDAGMFALDFTPIKCTVDEEGAYKISPYLIPPGTYRLAMGFKQGLGLEVQVEVLANGIPVAEPAVITLGTTTTYHYDRGNTLSNCYPEGYNEIRNELTHSKKGNYSTDGGPVYDEITIPDVNGDGSATEIVIRVKCENLAGTTKTMFHHWCLRPTEDNY